MKVGEHPAGNFDETERVVPVRQDRATTSPLRDVANRSHISGGRAAPGTEGWVPIRGYPARVREKVVDRPPRAPSTSAANAGRRLIGRIQTPAMMYM